METSGCFSCTSVSSCGVKPAAALAPILNLRRRVTLGLLRKAVSQKLCAPRKPAHMAAAIGDVIVLRSDLLFAHAQVLPDNDHIPQRVSLALNTWFIAGQGLSGSQH